MRQDKNCQEIGEQDILEILPMSDFLGDGAELGDTYQNDTICANTSQFSIRTSKPNKNDVNWKCYQRQTGYDGWSGAIVGNPTDSECNVLANCVGYAQGRFCEIYNLITGYSGTNKYFYLNCNAGDFIDRAKKTYPALEIGDTPKPGAILVMACPGKAGHVIIVERVNADGSIYTSESAYGGQAFFNCTRKKGDGRWGMGDKNYYQVGFIYNPAVKEEEPEQKFNIGDHVLLNGPLYRNATATESSGYASNKDTHVTRYYAGGIHHYNTTGDLGWCDASSMTLLKSVMYTVSVKQVEHGTIKVSATSAEAGNKIKVTAVPDDNYKLVKLLYNGTEIENNEFIMPAKNIIVTGEFVRVSYKVVCAECEHGKITVDKAEAIPDEIIKISYLADDGYILQLITSEHVEISDENTFIMPEQDVTIAATFAPEKNYNKLIKLIIEFIQKVIKLIFNKNDK